MRSSYPPNQILSILLPYLKTAGEYACQIQSRIEQQPDKEDMPNFFATALSDADLSVQTFVEVALLAHFPQIHFFGEEYQKSFNTKYFASIDPGNSEDEYLVTLDPIDGTRFYLDNFPNFQIILTVLNSQGYEGVLALSPAKGEYFYCLKAKGAFQGSWNDQLSECQPIQFNTGGRQPKILLGFAMQAWQPSMSAHFDVINVSQDYSATRLIPNVNGILTGDLDAAVLAKGNWIDGGAIAFLVEEAGGVVTDLEGHSLPPLSECQDRRFSGLVIATTSEIHQLIMKNRPSS